MDNNASAIDRGLSAEPELQVVVHAGPLAGKGFLLSGQGISFGRDTDNDIFWDDTQVSRHHARLVRRGEQLILEDLGSTNGTLVNGKPIQGEHVLQPADIISIGSSVFGVKGFSAPQTMGITQIAERKPRYPQPGPAVPPALASKPPSQPRPVPRPAPTPQKSDGSKIGMFALIGILLLVLVFVLLAGVSAFFFFVSQNADSVAQIPTVVITVPSDGSQVQVNQPVTVQATASDSVGVTRMELWVSGVKIAEAASPAADGQPTFTASLQWIPPAPGGYTLEVRAFNAQNGVSEPTLVTVNAVGDTSATETPTATATPDPSQPTIPPYPGLTTKTDLNVRSGPDIIYDQIGLLPAGTSAEIIGRNESREWWQIRFEPAQDLVGWVSADPGFSTTYNVENVPVVAAPPTPTGTPTETSTPVPPTPVPTNTPIPATATPTATPTATSTSPPQTIIEFNVSPSVIQGGDCVAVNWNVQGVREIYYQGNGVGGTDSRTECPKESTKYTLQVILLDGSQQIQERPVEVINPITSSGSKTLDHDETIDFDNGNTPGNDFEWDVDGSNRYFEALDGASISPQGVSNSLNALTYADCVNANYSEYDYIDGSDNSDGANELVDDRIACYRTNDGRYGKLRFPDRSSGSLRVEWLTWK